MVDVFEGPTEGLERIFGAFDKMSMRASGIDMPLRLLSPYQSVDLETYEKAIGAVRERYPGWLG